MNRYRRVEVRAFRHRTIVVSDELPTADMVTGETDPPLDGLLLSDVDLSEPIEPNSLEGQRILVEALRSLERRLTSETRARLREDETTLAPTD
jgi:hypothetical protein